MAVLDTGVNIADLTLTPYLEEGFSVVPSEDINDVNGHGTEMTHILTEGAPTNLRVVPIKIMNRFGRSSVYTVVDGLYKAKDLNVSIVNLSFGAVMGSETLHAAVQELHKSGITLVSAVGNLGGIDAFYPARYDEVIGVGAHDENYKIAPFSQIGVGVDLFVRGTEIRTKSLNNGWVTKNGTSHASAYLAKQLAYTEWLAVEKEEDEPIYVSFSNSVFEQSLHLGAIFAIANDELPSYLRSSYGSSLYLS